MKVIPSEAAEAIGFDTPCRAPGCRQTTTKQKPWCIDHLDFSPYVKQVAALAAAPSSDRRVVVHEILIAIHDSQPWSTQRSGFIARALDVPKERVVKEVMSLERGGLVALQVTRFRGKKMEHAFLTRIGQKALDEGLPDWAVGRTT